MGVLYIDKPKGITSFDVCYRLRRVLGTKRIGHTGTLDPNATGVMVVLFDKDTRANQFLVSNTKEYIAEVKLGISTDTLDIDGEVVERRDEVMPSSETISSVLNGFLGKSMQLPPLTSAIKVKGKRLFEYQRENKEVEIPMREIEVFEIELLDVNADSFVFRTKVSSGTYIRAIVRDALEKMGVIGTLSELRRTAIDEVTVDRCVPLEDVLNGDIRAVDLYDVMSRYFQLIELKDVKRAKEGKPLRLYKCGRTVVIVNQRNVIAVYEKNDEDGLYHCVRGLW